MAIPPLLLSMLQLYGLLRCLNGEHKTKVSLVICGQETKRDIYFKVERQCELETLKLA